MALQTPRLCPTTQFSLQLHYITKHIGGQEKAKKNAKNQGVKSVLRSLYGVLTSKAYIKIYLYINRYIL